MKRSMARWSTTVAAAALLTLPAASLAQGTGTQPPTGTGASGTTGAAAATQPSQAPANPEVAKQHLTAARNSLSEMTQLPAASQLTGEARTQVSQLITNFNELITTSSQWRASYAKVEANLNALLGTATTDEAAARTSGTEGAVGTSGAVTLDPALRAKLVEVRNHLDKFEEAAGGASTPSSEAAAGSAATATGSMTGSTGTSTTGAPATEPQTATSATQPSSEELLRHIQAIETILSGQTAASGTATAGTTGTAGTTTESPVTLTPTQVQQLRTHLSELKRLINQR